MSEKNLIDDCSNYWSTGITRARPNEISICGYPIEELIGRVSFVETLYLMLRGELPSSGHARLLEAAMVASVDHGPQAPSIAAARMAATCGVSFSSIVASGVSLLGDIHGGAGQQCMSLLYEMRGRVQSGEDPKVAVHALVGEYMQSTKFIPGFGHRYHRVDPRALKLNEMMAEEIARGSISGEYLKLASLVEEDLFARRGKRIPQNIDGVTAALYCEVGFSPELGRAVFVLSRSVGIIANAWEEREAGSRLKGPMPKEISPRYTGRAIRHLGS